MIIDTNALSALADGDENIAAVVGRCESLAVPVVVLGEFRFGIAGSRHYGRYKLWLEDMIRFCRLLSIDNLTSEFYATVRLELKASGRPVPQNDLWIAALARQYRMPIVSRDKHFDSVPEIQRLTW